MREFYLSTILVLVFAAKVSAQKATVDDGSLPVPALPDLLFYVQRDPDINTVVYTLHRDEYGHIHPKDPIKIFWIKYTEGGIHKPLNLLQKDLAYGLSIKSAGPEKFEIKAIAYPKMPMQLLKDQNDKYYVRVLINSHECALKRIFIHITGGSALQPEVAFLEFHGIELSTNKEISERIYPN